MASSNLHQKAVGNQPNTKKTALNSTPLTHRTGRTMDIARSNNIKHFAPKVVNTINKKIVQASDDIKHISHPLAQKTNQIRKSMANMSTKVAAPKSLKAIKDEAIEKALSKPAEKASKNGFFKRNAKFINIFSVSLAILLITGCIVYLNMPSLSVRVASAQAGISAGFPEYHPDGYSVNGPVTYSDGQVTINFKSNTSESKFIIKQVKSSWDSSAVRNMVNKEAKGEFITTTEKGLTIFTYRGNAAWVNGGILYTINGDAPLSGDQIRRIATSL